ncbi:MAG: YicC family protein [Thermodesulfobacteriota bacterium]|nr:YicC family protein [Thermodesulfobacteriota bacterium]
MIKSMTGFGRGEAVTAGKRMQVEMKSLNHRYLEIFLRMPATLFPLETEIKKKIGERFSRGKIEVSIRMDNEANQDGTQTMMLNLPLVRQYYSLLSQIKEELHLADEVTLNMISGFRDLYIPKEVEEDVASLWKRLEGSLAEAMDRLTDMRITEGEALGRDLAYRMNRIQQLLQIVALRAPEVVVEYRQRLSDRIRELTQGMIIDEARIHQEVAILAEKSDITEEVVRLESHIGQFMELLAGEEAIGRKVDFLIQEMNREINTIGSKSGDGETARQVIEIKSELAKVREQIQNVE